MHFWKKNIFVKSAIFLMAVFCVITIVTLQMQYNTLQTQKQELTEELSVIANRIEELQNALNTPFDDDYIIKIAREKLNLRLPEEIVFYNDLTK